MPQRRGGGFHDSAPERYSAPGGTLVTNQMCPCNRLSGLWVRKSCPPSVRSFAGACFGSSCTPRNRERLRRGYAHTLPNHGSYSQDTSHVETLSAISGC